MMKMSLLKKTNIPQILFLILVFASCGKEIKSTKNTPQEVEDTLPRMKRQVLRKDFLQIILTQ
jgi:PBP1b-binding outer membrane lipoprotein LpoB